jgi:hypothetical protein
MIRKTYRIRRRITVAIALVASLAAWAAQPALAFDGRSPDTRVAAEQAKAGSVIDLRSPDTREAAEHGKPGSRAFVDLRSPDTREAADQRKPSVLVDLRSPDTRDAAIPVVPEIRVAAPELISSDRFNWGDFGIGVGIALGSMLLLAGLAASASAARQKRDERTGPATT